MEIKFCNKIPPLHSSGRASAICPPSKSDGGLSYKSNVLWLRCWLDICEEITNFVLIISKTTISFKISIQLPNPIHVLIMPKFLLFFNFPKRSNRACIHYRLVEVGNTLHKKDLSVLLHKKLKIKDCRRVSTRASFPSLATSAIRKAKHIPLNSKPVAYLEWGQGQDPLHTRARGAGWGTCIATPLSHLWSTQGIL